LVITLSPPALPAPLFKRKPAPDATQPGPAGDAAVAGIQGRNYRRPTEPRRTSCGSRGTESNASFVGPSVTDKRRAKLPVCGHGLCATDIASAGDVRDSHAPDNVHSTSHERAQEPAAGTPYTMQIRVVNTRPKRCTESASQSMAEKPPTAPHRALVRSVPPKS
jgi:hypothetical protein